MNLNELTLIAKIRMQTLPAKLNSELIDSPTKIYVVDESRSRRRQYICVYDTLECTFRQIRVGTCALCIVFNTHSVRDRMSQRNGYV